MDTDPTQKDFDHARVAWVSTRLKELSIWSRSCRFQPAQGTVGSNPAQRTENIRHQPRSKIELNSEPAERYKSCGL